MTPPVLFLVFNRPDTSRRVFEAIRDARPERLYVAADGPRADRDGEEEKCAEVRRIATAVDWPCEVRTLFRDENLGCGLAVSKGIDWFFKNEDSGIVLEDDTLPEPAFFQFCAEGLEKYREDRQIFQLCGYNHFPSPLSSGVFRSRYAGVWGWASWKSRWSKYDYHITQRSIDKEDLLNIRNSLRWYERKFFCELIEQARSIDTWDYQLLFSMLKGRYMCIRPMQNLVTNIGFGKDATHTQTHNSDIENNLGRNVIVNISREEVMLGEISDFYFFARRFNDGFKRLAKMVLKDFWVRD